MDGNLAKPNNVLPQKKFHWEGGTEDAPHTLHFFAYAGARKRLRGQKMNRRRPSRQRQPLDLQSQGGVPVAKLGPDIKAKIGQQLRIMYGEIVNQGVPDRFVEILRGLDGPDDEGSQNGSS